MTIKVDKGIPFPERTSNSTNIYPFEDLEVGNSFFAAGKTRRQMDNACGHWRKKKGWKFTLEYREEEQLDPQSSSDWPTKIKVYGTRVWRKE